MPLLVVYTLTLNLKLLLYYVLQQTRSRSFPSQGLPIERDIEVTNEQLDTTVEETHLSEMLSQSDSTHDGYLESGLSSGQQSDVTINTLREVPTSKLILYYTQS